MTVDELVASAGPLPLAEGSQKVAENQDPVILHVCETAKGGVGSYLNLFADAPTMGARSIVVVPEQHADHLSPALPKVTFDRSGRGAGTLRAMIRAAFAAIKAHRPDFVFFHSSFSLGALAAFRARRVKVPMIYCSHGWAVARYEAKSRKAKIISAAEGRLCALADVVIDISKADLEQARALNYRGRHVLVENAVTPPLPAKHDLFDDRDINLLFVGRLDRQKGVDILVDAATRVLEKRDDIRLHIVGTAINNDIGRPIQASDRVHLHGWVGGDRLDSFYGSADALIVPSRWEGFGLVVPEAFRNGTPALVARTGALPDLVTPGVTGTVFDLSTEALSKCLTDLDKAALRAMRPHCHAVYESRFSATRFAEDFAGVLKELRGRPRRYGI